MANRLPVRAPVSPAVRYFPTPAQQQIVLVSPAELAARKREYRIAYQAWAKRQAAFAERDRRVRRIGQRILAGTAVVLLLGVGWLVWLAYTTLQHASGAVLAVLGLLAAGLLISMAGAIGHRCITIIQHWH